MLDADEEEKVDFIDVKNDVKNNSSTTDYLPTFFEYFDCNTIFPSASVRNLSVDCCLDGEFYFDTVGSSFMPPVEACDNFVSESISNSFHQGTRNLCVGSQMCKGHNCIAPTSHPKNCTFHSVSATRRKGYYTRKYYY